MWRWILFVFCISIQKGTPQFIYQEHKPTVPFQIVGIFETANTQLYAFNESMHHTSGGSVKIQPTIIQPSRTDSYSMWRELCANRAIRPIAVIGPQNPITDGAVRDQCALANVPHIQATWQPLDPDLQALEEEEEEEEQEGEEEAEEGEEPGEDEEEELSREEKWKQETPTFKRISINFFPNADEINIALAKVLKYYSWENFAVLYEDDFGLMRIQKVLANYTVKHSIRVRRLNPAVNNDQVFKDLYKNQDSRILLDCHVNRIEKYLDEAASMHMVGNYQHYIFTSLDTSMIAGSIKNRTCNITWLSFAEYDRPDLASRVGKWIGPDDNDKNRATVQDFEIEALLMDDIANHITQSMDKIKRKPQSPLCGNSAIPWQYGAKLQNQILNTQTKGITGNIEFDKRGRRRNYVLYVNEKDLNQVKTIGRWESANGSSIIETSSSISSKIMQSISKEFKIISKRNKPYFFEKCKENCIDEPDDDDKENTEDLKYEGFAVDLVKEIFKIFRKENYNYTYKFVDKVTEDYGKFDNATQKWNGMIGLLLDKKVDLAVCDFTITEERKKVIDFSHPFMSLGISILYVQERKIKPGMFSFLNPYTVDVWMYACTAYCAVSIILYICARISPADWENPEPCDKDPEELENIWTFKNCAWLTMGSIMTQGCDILPKHSHVGEQLKVVLSGEAMFSSGHLQAVDDDGKEAVGTRWVCGMWWFFAVIFCQTYIAQLSASMTSALEIEPINSVENLAQQTKVLYGAFARGSTLAFFRTSKDKMYQKMYETMEANPVVLVDSNDEGEQRVLTGAGKYAFFMESSTIDYKLKRNCDLKKVGGELDSKDYGIAMPANSPFRSQINRAILSLKESTTIDEIKKKWWTEKYGAKNCTSQVKADDVEGDLEMENLVGLFYVLGGGLFLSLFVTAAEFLNEIRNIVVREQLTHKEAIIQELKASLNFFQLQKPIIKNPSRAPSIESSDSSEKKEKRNALLQNFMDFEKEVQ